MTRPVSLGPRSWAPSERDAIGHDKTIRRRQFPTLVLLIVGVAALVGVTAGLLRSPGPDASPSTVSASTTAGTTSTSGASPTAASAVSASAPDVPFVSDGSILDMFGRETRLPPTWAVNTIHSIGQVAVLDVSEGDERFAARVAADGSITEMDSFKPPLAVSSDAGKMAALAITPVGAADTPQHVTLVLVDALTGKETARAAAATVLGPELIMDPGAASVLLSDATGAISVWSTAQGVITPLALGGLPVRASVSASADRSLLMTLEESGRLSAWRWPDKTKVWTTAVIADGSPGASPDGVFVAVPAQRRVALLDATTGKLLRLTMELPGLGPRRVTWEDSAHFLASDPDALGDGVARCAAATGSCQKLDLGDTPVVIAQ